MSLYPLTNLIFIFVLRKLKAKEPICVLLTPRLVLPLDPEVTPSHTQTLGILFMLLSSSSTVSPCLWKGTYAALHA